MKYERLTKQNWHNAKFSINTEANNRIFLHRLWVLENRIENFGTLPDKKDYNRITDRRDSPLVMSQWAGSPDDLAVYNRLWELENRIENDEFNKQNVFHNMNVWRRTKNDRAGVEREDC